MANQSIKKNYLLNTSYQILNLISPLITAPYVSRVLGAEGVGTYSFTSSFVAFFCLFAVLGITTYGQRTIAQCRDDIDQRSKAFWELETISIISTMICVAVWVLFVYIYPEYKIYFLILTMSILASCLDISWFFSGLERFSYIVFRNATIKLAGILLVFLFVKDKSDLWIYFCILSGSKFFGNASMWCRLPQFVRKRSLYQLEIKQHFKETLAYFIPTIAASVYTYCDKIMLGFFANTTEVGYYEQASKIINMAYVAIASLNTVMAPRMSYLFAMKNDEEIRSKLEMALATILTLGIACMFGICAVAENFVPWFFGDGFSKVVIILMLKSPLVVILCLHNFLSAQYLIPSGQRARSTKGVLTGVAVNVVFNILLIPRWQSVGAVIATLFAESSVCIVYWYMSKDYVPVKLLAKYLPKQLMAAAVMLFVLRWIGRGYNGNVFVTIIQVIFGVVAYGIMLIVLKECFTMSVIKSIARKLKAKP